MDVFIEFEFQEFGLHCFAFKAFICHLVFLGAVHTKIDLRSISVRFEKVFTLI